MALNNFHTPGPQTDVRNLMLAQLNQSSLANNIFNSALGEMNKFDTGARNLNTQKLTRDIANMSLSELEDYYNNGKTAIDILNEKDGTGFMYNETDPNLLNMVNQRDNDYKTAKNNIVFNELQQLTPQQIIDSGNLFDKFQFADKLTPQQQAWLTAARGSAQKTLRTQALNELSPEEIADAETIGNIKFPTEYGTPDAQDAERFSTLQGKYRADLDSKNYSLAMQLLNSIPNPLDRARLVANPPEFKAMLEQSGIKFRKGETFTQLMSALGATYNDPTKKGELDKIFDDQLTSEITTAIQDGKSLTDVISLIDNAKNTQGNSLTEQQKNAKIEYILDNSKFVDYSIDALRNKNKEFEKNYYDLTDETLSDDRRAAAFDYFKNNIKDYIRYVPKRLQPFMEKRLLSTLENTYKKSNLAIEQTRTDRINTAKRAISEDLKSISDNTVREDLEAVLDGSYKMQIPKHIKDEKGIQQSEGTIRGGIQNMLELVDDDSNQSIRKIYKFISDPKTKKSPLASYFYSKLMDTYSVFRSNPTKEGANSKGVLDKLSSSLNGLNEAIDMIDNYKIINSNGTATNINFIQP